jgi:predicted MFS family arabinose efflux permease
MMLAGPAVLTFGWRELWLGNGAVTLAAAALIALVPLPTAPGANLGTRWGNAGAVLLSKGALLLGIAFGLYTFQVMAMSGLFPALLVDRVGLSVSEAGLIAALTLLANAVGNASAGLLLRAGLPVWGVVFGSFSFMALAALGIFSEHLPVAAIAVLASASLGVTGLIPGSIFAAASRLAPTAATLVVLLGLINQGSNIGTLAGPSSLGLLVQHFGWSSAWVLFAAVALCGIAAAIGLRAALRGAIR